MQRPVPMGWRTHRWRARRGGRERALPLSTLSLFLQGLYEGCEHPDRGYDAKPSTPTATRNRRPEPPPLMQPCRTINAHIHPEHPMSIGHLIRFDELKNNMNQGKVMAYFR